MTKPETDPALSASWSAAAELRAQAFAIEVDTIRTALKRTDGNVMRAARLLGVERNVLHGALFRRHKALLAEFPPRHGRPIGATSVTP